MNNFIDLWRQKRGSLKPMKRESLRRIKKALTPDAAYELHQEAFQNINCLECANCCSSIPPIITKSDVTRISKHLGIKESEFMNDYVVEDDDGDMVFNASPCRFLLSDNTCLIYEKRPKACRRYPHTEGDELVKNINLLPKNAPYCPAAYFVLQKLEQSLI